MKKLIVAVVLSFVAGAYAQTCIVPAPVAPPVPTYMTIYLPLDGGTVGCQISATFPGQTVPPNRYPLGNVKCANMVAIAVQAVANDNGWSDGGTP